MRIFLWIGVLSIFFIFSKAFGIKYELLEKREKTSGRYFEQGIKLEESGDVEGAIINYLAALDFEDVAKYRAEIYFKLGELFWNIGDLKSAREFYSLSLSNYRSEETERKLKIVLLEIGEADIDSILKTADSELYYYLGRYFFRKGDYQQACNNFLKVKIGEKYYYKARYMCGNALLISGVKDRAIPLLQAGLQSNEIQEVVNLSLARAYFDMGKFDLALQHYNNIQPNSKYYYDVKFEICWTLFNLGKKDEARECVDEFKKMRKTFLSRRIDVLSAYMEEDIMKAYPLLSSILDYTIDFIATYEEVKGMSDDFWKEAWKPVFERKERDITSWVENHPNYIKYLQLRAELERLKGLLETAKSDLDILRISSQVAGDKTIRKILMNVWFLEDRIQQLMVAPIIHLMTPKERSLWELSLTLRREMRTLETQARDIIRKSLEKTQEVSPYISSSQSARKKYSAYSSAGKNASDSLNFIQIYTVESGRIISSLIDIMNRKYGDLLGENFKRLQDMLFELERIRGIMNYIWLRIGLIVDMRTKMEEDRIRNIENEIARLSKEIDSFYPKLIKGVVSDIKDEQLKTFSYAQYGIIEASWRMKAKEGEELDRIWRERKKAEVKVRETFSNIEKRIDALSFDIKGVQTKSSFSDRIQDRVQNIDELEKRIEEMRKIKDEIKELKE